jgi:hypothetical protein
VRLESKNLALALFAGLVGWLLFGDHNGWGPAIGMFVGTNLVAGFTLLSERRARSKSGADTAL